MKIFAFYLPQYYCIPENDKWWGKGYTEWVSSKAAKPLFEGHYQPHEPLDDNYYELPDIKTMKWQAELMHKYGIDAMCFYHYWFDDEKKILEAPAEFLRENKDINMPYFFSWANQSWTTKWTKDNAFPWVANKEEDDDKELSYIFEQKYGREESWKKHFEYLLSFFYDERYLKVDNKPLVHILDIGKIPCIDVMLYYWRKLARMAGFDGIYIIGSGTLGTMFEDHDIDVFLPHEPGITRNTLNYHKVETVYEYNYAEAYERILSYRMPEDKKIAYCAFTDFDNTPRYGKQGCYFYGSSPLEFEYYFYDLMKKSSMMGIDFIFIDAWNEWGEGMHLEPDKREGTKWLEAVNNAKKRLIQKDEMIEKEMLYLSEIENKLNIEIHRREKTISILDRWIEIIENGVKLSDKLKRMGISSLYLYGNNILAHHFIHTIKGGEIEIRGIIDTFQKGDFEGFIIKDIDGVNLNEIDAIIITAVNHMNSILKMIKKKNDNVDVYSFEEFLFF